MTLIKADIERAITKEMGYKRAKSSRLVAILLEALKSSLESGEEVMIGGFGKFCVMEKSARRGRNPSTGESMTIKPRKVVVFRCSVKLRDKINSSQNSESTNQQLCETLFEKYHCVEMRPVGSLPIYQFKLYREPDNGDALLFVKPDSRLIKYLQIDKVLDMKYMFKNIDYEFSSIPTQIRSISKQNDGPFRGHYKVSISIAEKQ